MAAILTLPITCVSCGQRSMERLRPADEWECGECYAARYGMTAPLDEAPGRARRVEPRSERPAPR